MYECSINILDYSKCRTARTPRNNSRVSIVQNNINNFLLLTLLFHRNFAAGNSNDFSSIAVVEVAFRGRERYSKGSNKNGEIYNILLLLLYKVSCVCLRRIFKLIYPSVSYNSITKFRISLR